MIFIRDINLFMNGIQKHFSTFPKKPWWLTRKPRRWWKIFQMQNIALPLILFTSFWTLTTYFRPWIPCRLFTALQDNNSYIMILYHGRKRNKIKTETLKCKIIKKFELYRPTISFRTLGEINLSLVWNETTVISGNIYFRIWSSY